MNFKIKELKSSDHKRVVYADDIVIFLYDSNLDLAIASLNNSLELLQKLLTSSFFSVATEKCKAMTFTRRRYLLFPKITIYDYGGLYISIPIVHNIKYRGLTLDSNSNFR